MRIANALLGASGAPPEGRIEFWTKPNFWPEDCQEYIFAGRAIQEFGQHKFGSKWISADVSVDLISKLPEAYNIYTSSADIERAVELVRTASGQSLAWHGILGTVPKMPTDNEWERARGLASIAHDDAWNRFWPFVQVASELANAARDSTLATATCSQLGGEMVDRPWHFWNFRSRWMRFETCRVTPNAPQNAFLTQDAGHWIYFRRDSFEKLCSGTPEQQTVRLPEAIKEQATKQDASRRSVGRPAGYDWANFASELFRRYQLGLLPESDSQIAAAMAEWCFDRWGKEPTDSVLREKVATLLSGVRAAGN